MEEKGNGKVFFPNSNMTQTDQSSSWFPSLNGEGLEEITLPREKLPIYGDRGTDSLQVRHLPQLLMERLGTGLRDGRFAASMNHYEGILRSLAEGEMVDSAFFRDFQELAREAEENGGKRKANKETFDKVVELLGGLRTAKRK